MVVWNHQVSDQNMNFQDQGPSVELRANAFLGVRVRSPGQIGTEVSETRKTGNYYFVLILRYKKGSLTRDHDNYMGNMEPTRLGQKECVLVMNMYSFEKRKKQKKSHMGEHTQ